MFKIAAIAFTSVIVLVVLSTALMQDALDYEQGYFEEEDDNE